MMSIIAKLLPFADKGILSKIETSTLILSGFRNDINFKALQAELETSWLELCKEEAAIRVKNALVATQESRRPENFSDLAIKLQLGRITPDEREQLDAYYDALDELEREAKALLQRLEKAKSIEELNKIPWPEWVGWEALPVRFLLLAESPKPEPPKPEPVQPDLPESGSAQPEPVKPDPIDLEDKT